MLSRQQLNLVGSSQEVVQPWYMHKEHLTSFLKLKASKRHKIGDMVSLQRKKHAKHRLDNLFGMPQDKMELP